MPLQRQNVSRRLRSAAAAECERIDRQIERLRKKETPLLAKLEPIWGAIAALQEQRAVLQRLADGQSDSPAGVAALNGHRILAGAAIREQAVRVLREKHGPGGALHYRDWFDLLVEDGFMPRGENPLATFLTQLSRAPEVGRSTQSGIYYLKEPGADD